MSSPDRDLPPLPQSYVEQLSISEGSSYRTRTSASGSSRTRSHKRSSRDSKESFEAKIAEILQKLTDQVKSEKERADDAERRVEEITGHLRAVNTARIEALQDAARAREELRLYKIQLEVAQKEIFRAQDVIDQVDQERYSAQKEAATLRSRNRQLNSEIIVQQARDEAWRAGMQEGLDRGRELSMDYTQSQGPPVDHVVRFPTEDSVHSDTSSVSEAPRPVVVERHSSLSIAPSTTTQRRPRSRTSTIVPNEPLPVPPAPAALSRPPTEGPPQEPPPIQPIPVANVQPSPRIGSVIIPPDNLIPSIEQGRILLPPPFEFQRHITTPEPPPSPRLHALSDTSQDPIPIPEPRPKSSHQQRRSHRRHSSSGSNSSSLSALDIVNDPHGPHGHGTLRTPMSAIEEVNSMYTTSPNHASFTQGADHSIRHQRSVSDNGARAPSVRPPSVRAPSIREADRQSQYSTTRSYQGQEYPPSYPPYLAPGSQTNLAPSGGSIRDDQRYSQGGHSQGASESTAPDITIVPPPTSHQPPGQADSVSLWGPGPPGSTTSQGGPGGYRYPDSASGSRRGSVVEPPRAPPSRGSTRDDEEPGSSRNRRDAPTQPVNVIRLPVDMAMAARTAKAGLIFPWNGKPDPWESIRIKRPGEEGSTSSKK